MAASPINDFKEFRLLVEVQGPFISSSVLRDTFPQGFPKEETLGDDLRELRIAYEMWQDAPPMELPAQNDWIRYVLTNILEFDSSNIAVGQAIPQSLRVRSAETHGDLVPDLLITTPGQEDLLGNATPGNPLVPIFVSPRGQRLDKTSSSESNRLTPLDQTIAFLRGSSFQIGLLTNGEQWAVVHCPPSGTTQSGVTSIATWYAEMWLEESVTFRAFRALFGARRWFNAEPTNTLPKLLERSALNQGAVTAQLGRQVRQAVALLISALDRADQDKGRGLLSGIAETTLYEAAISVMMRLVFLFFAEERELLPSSDPLYASAYAVSTIREQLQADADRFGPEVLERRHDAWSRLLATFRAVHSGLGHDRITLPAYGGQLFDPDRFPFLEGRAAGSSWKDTQATPLPVDNRTVLYALEALQFLRERGSEPRQLTFRELDVPDIGHIYESLLDHTAKRASGLMVGLVGREGEEPEVALTQLQTWQKQGREKLVSELVDCASKTANSIHNLLEEEVDDRLRDRLRTACQADESVLAEVLPFANLVRNDPWGNPVLILPGSIFVTEGADRRSTGTHYTPTSLTEPIVQYTLEPVVYSGPAEGFPREEWRLKSPKQLLELKVCDMACGSGAFLVAAARYLAGRLEEAWAALGAFEPGAPRRSPDGFESSGARGEDLIPLEVEEQSVYALRLVTQRCIYGVDKNPLATEMAKLSLWLLTLAKGKPFTFVDHAIKPGDSLIGASREQLEAFDLNDISSPVFGFGPTLDFLRNTRETLALVRAETVADVERQARLLSEANSKTEALRLIGDALIGMELRGVKHGERFPIGSELGILLQSDDFKAVKEISGRYSAGMRPFHWNLEFPEAFGQRAGFDAIVGNPPFIGGQKITGVLGKPYREFLVNQLAKGRRGSADYSAYFFLRAAGLLGSDCCFGLLATNSIAQGDTREVGLDQIVGECVIFRAVSSRPWPGEANLEIASVWARKGDWRGTRVLDDREAEIIGPMLTAQAGTNLQPRTLASNLNLSFQGSKLVGKGFILRPDEAASLIASDPKNSEVVFPYLNGEDLTSRPDQSASRWVINFQDWSLDRAKQYPACLNILLHQVKGRREDTKYSEQTRNKWWQFERPRVDLYAKIAGLARVLVAVRVSAFHCFALAEPNQVYSDRLVVFALGDAGSFALLTSSIHEVWAHRPGMTTHETRPTYFSERAFETFPFPRTTSALQHLGEKYHSLRAQILKQRQIGLTKLYQAFHSDEQEMQALRNLHMDLDREIATAYGWAFDLGHGLHETKVGIRFTISPQANVRVLESLLALNHQRHAAEHSVSELTSKRKPPKKPKPVEEGPLLASL